MIADLTNLTQTTHTTNIIRIEKINFSPENIATFITITSKAFNSSAQELSKALTTFLRQIKTGHLTLYIGQYKNKKVSAGMVIKHTEKLVSLHWIGTLPKYRNKGMGLALTQQALTDASMQGIQHAILLSSTAGKSIYNRSGFKEYCLYHMYGNTA